MIDDPIQIVTGGDLRFLSGVQVTLSSALIGIPEERSVVVHILDGGLGNDARNNLQELARRCHRHVQVVFRSVPKSSLKAFVPGPGNSRMYYARIGMASLLTDVQRVIYIDSDTLILGDLSDLWEIDCNNSIAMACEDRKVRRLAEDSPWLLTPEEEKLPYFNSGVMSVNLEQWRTEDIEQQCLNLIAKPAGPYTWWDQTILNHLLRGRVGFLPQAWNWQSEEFPAMDNPSPCVLHYTTGLKPWLYWSGAFRFEAWRSCYQACVGSPALLFLKNGSWKGLINGFFDSLLDNFLSIRSLYLRYLNLSLKLSENKQKTALLDQKINFLKSPRTSRNRSREKQLLTEYRKRLTQRLGSVRADNAFRPSSTESRR